MMTIQTPLTLHIELQQRCLRDDPKFTAPTWNRDLNLSKWGLKGDLILSEMGTKRGPSVAEKGTKWGPKKRIFDKLTETC